MRPSLFLLFVVGLLLSCQQKTSQQQQPPSSVRLPSEFEQQAAVWVLWPTIEHVADMPNRAVTIALIDSLLPYVAVKLVCPNDSVLASAKSYISAKTLANKQFTLLSLDYEGFWARDMGPAFVFVNGQKSIADHSFNNWGGADSVACQRDESLDELVAAKFGLPIYSSSIICEGGNHETDGVGTLMATLTVEKQRNPTLSQQQIEEKYRALFGIKQFIWLNKGVHEDDFSWESPIEGPNGQQVYTLLTTGGHIDEYARFADANTILLAEVDSSDLATDPIARENLIRINENLKIIQAARTPDGKPYRIIRMPMPRSIVRQLSPKDPTYSILSSLTYTKKPFPTGKPILGVAATSYLNFLITNGVVIAQKYNQDRDQKAKNILETAFPGRKIIMIDALRINLGGGGIHCITMHEPK